MRITKNMLIGDILRVDGGMAQILMQNGMGCVYCPAPPGRAWRRPVKSTVWTRRRCSAS